MAAQLSRPSASRRIVWDEVEHSVSGEHLAGVTYYVYRSSEPTGTWTRLTPVPIPTNSYVDRDVDPNTDYHYAVAAVTADGIEGQLSRVARAHGN